MILGVNSGYFLEHHYQLVKHGVLFEVRDELLNAI
jgi:hypothetical protein